MVCGRGHADFVAGAGISCPRATEYRGGIAPDVMDQALNDTHKNHLHSHCYQIQFDQKGEFMSKEQGASAHESIHAAYVAAFAEIGAAVKDAKNPHFKSTYADLSSVVDAVKPALTNHGLAFVQMPRPNEGGAEISTVLIHSSGEMLDLGSTFVPASKKDAQGFGSAMTYARRYALQTAFGVPAEDDDGNAAVASAPKQQQRSASKPVDEGMPDKEYNTLIATAKTAGVSEAGLMKKYGVDNLRMLSGKQYTQAIDGLSAMIAEKAREASNAQGGEFGEFDAKGFDQ